MRVPLSLRSLITATCLAALLSGTASVRAQQPAPPSSSAPPGQTSTPGPAQTKPAKPAAKDDNAFPEEESKAAEKQAAEAERADRKAAGAGSAVTGPESETGSSSRDKLQGIDILGDHDSRIASGAGGTILDPKLSTQDLKVGQQYMAMGNYPGAYERFKEACAVNPGNIEAVFYLAEAARKTAHLDESAENYRVYLAAQPDGAKAKSARKALIQLQGK